MAERIYIFDTTLRDGEQAPGYSMNLEEKIRVAKQLETLGVDIIEAGFAISSPGDFESVEAIAKAVDNVTVKAGSDEVFVSYPDGTAAWYYFNTVSNASYFTELSPIVLEGVYVKNDGGKVVYSTDGSEWTATNADSIFDDEEYLYDIHGDEHGRMFGSDSSVCNETRITGLGDGFISIYSPTDRGAALIEKSEAVDGSLKDVHITETELSTGTNYIDTENIPDVYMLWNSLEGMEPLCKEYMP